MHSRLRFPSLLLATAILIFGAHSLAVRSKLNRSSRPPVFVAMSRQATRFALSAPAGDSGSLEASGRGESPVFENEDANEIYNRRIRVGTESAAAGSKEPAFKSLVSPLGVMPLPTLTFEGVDSDDNFALFGGRVLPPDTNGDVGPRHYVQMVNLAYRVFDKNGLPLTPPRKLGSLWEPLGRPCGGRNHGDPVVLYDPLADRWLLSQLCIAPTPFYHQLIAISQTNDPTGGYFLYDFMMPNIKFNDYPKFGVWPDAYYMTDNEFDFFSDVFLGAGVFAFDRAKMLVGDPTASYIYFDLGERDPSIGGMLPSDLDGPTPPPRGSPSYFAYYTADEFGDPADALRIFEFHADFSNPLSSTFTERPESPIRVAPFDPLSPPGRNNIPQPPPTKMDHFEGLDALSDRLLHRLAYRNDGDHESLVVTHTVNVGTGVTFDTYQAGVRYYELHRSLPGGPFTIAGQTSYAPDKDNRWMGSAALDHDGNLAVGYSVSSVTTYPSIRYAGRLAGDPPDGLFRAETTLAAGLWMQDNAINRWGDYSAMSIDPTDDCTFWFTSEYYGYDNPATTAEWQTRVGKFAFPSCSPVVKGVLQGIVTNAATGLPIQGAVVATLDGFSRVTNSYGFYQFVVAPGSYDMVASGIDLLPQDTSGVLVTEGGATLQNFTLEPHLVPRLVAGGIPSVSSESCAPTTGTIDPGETVGVELGIKNLGSADTSDLVATLLPTGGVSAPGPSQTYGVVQKNGDIVSRTFTFTADGGLACGTRLTLTLSLRDGGVDLGSVSYVVPLGGLGPPITGTYMMENIPVSIPAKASVDIPIAVTEPGTIADLDVGLRLNHVNNDNLIISLIHPDGTTVTLWRRGGSASDRIGKNFGDGPNDCTGRMALFDDSADFFVTYLHSPFADQPGRPVEQLLPMNGRPQEGIWKLRVTDFGSGDVGSVGCVQLRIVRERPLCCPFQSGSPTIVAAPPVSVADESCRPTNGAPDQDERVTVTFPLRNVGTGSATDLVATLLPGVGVEAPGPPQSYGAVAPVGPSVSRTFSFVAGGACGSNIIATLALEDVGGAGYLGTILFPIRLGGTVGYTSTFVNRDPVLVSYSLNGTAMPYPSTISVSGVTGTVSKVTVSLFDFTDPAPGLVHILVVGPGGQKIILMGQASQGYGLEGASLIFDDEAPNRLPINNLTISGKYRPTDFSPGYSLAAPAPPGPYSNPPALSVFNGIDPNGIWKLYAVGFPPDFKGDPKILGPIAGGWRVVITTSDPACCSEPCALSCPAPVNVTSEPGRCGATATFGGAGASGSCGVVSCSLSSGSFFGLGTTRGGCTATTSSSSGPTASCGFDVTTTAATATRAEPIAVQYSDVAPLSATVDSPGCPTYTGTLRFLTDATSAGSTPVGGNGRVTLPVQILLPQGTHALEAAFTADTPGILDSSGTDLLTVAREEATVSPSASSPTLVQASRPRGTASSVGLSARIAEVPDGSPGDITRAVPVTFTMVPVVAKTPLSCVAASGSLSGGNLTVKCDVVNVPVDVYDVTIDVGGDFYFGAGKSVAAVFDPSLGSTRGTGTLTRKTGTATFDFNARYSNDKTLGGRLQYLESRSTGSLIFTSTSLRVLSIVGKTAVFLGTGTLNGVQGYGFRAIAVDGGETVTSDLLGLTVTDPSGAVVPSLTFSPHILSSGHIKVGP